MRLIDADFLKIHIKDLMLRCRKMIWSGGELYEECLRVVQRMIDDAPTIAPPPNDPLTLEELREMDGEPVWTTRFPLRALAVGNCVPVRWLRLAHYIRFFAALPPWER